MYEIYTHPQGVKRYNFEKMVSDEHTAQVESSKLQACLDRVRDRTRLRVIADYRQV